jgi:hypothetical protein
MRIFEIEDEGNPEELLQFIKENCGPWLSQTNNGAHKVYRGLGYESVATGESVPGDYPKDLVFKKPIRPDRRPLGSKTYREIYNKLLKDIGAKAKRENSVPVTSDEEQSVQFGVPYVFMPIGNFHYTWSEVLIDWGSFDLEDPNEFEEFHDEENPELTFEEAMYEYLRPTIRFDQFGPSDLIHAIQSDHELFIAADYGLYIDMLVYREILNASR